MRKKMKFLKPLLVTLFTLILTTGLFHNVPDTPAASGGSATGNGCTTCEIDPSVSDYKE